MITIIAIVSVSAIIFLSGVALAVEGTYKILIKNMKFCHEGKFYIIKKIED